VLLLAGLFDATSDRIAQDLATLFGTGTGFCMNTISGDKTQLPGEFGQEALPITAPARSRLRLSTIDYSMPAPAPANPFRRPFCRKSTETSIFGEFAHQKFDTTSFWDRPTTTMTPLGVQSLGSVTVS
jgi:hypothetical protein